MINKVNESKLTKQEVRRVLSYDSETGILRWRLTTHRCVQKGRVAGFIHKLMGYRIIGINKCRYLSHRLAWLHYYGVWPEDQLDHLNGVRADNRISNLIEANQSQNGKNKKLPNTNTTGRIGVYWYPRYGKWLAQIKVDGLAIHGGYFDTFEDAVKKRKKMEDQYGFNINHGRIVGGLFNS